MISNDDKIEAARKRLGDLKGVHTRWYAGLDGREDHEVISEMESIAYSAFSFVVLKSEIMSNADSIESPLIALTSNL